jgi:hypothetical protein
LSTDHKKPFTRIIPGEPVPQFGNLTPEQFAAMGRAIEHMLLTMFGCIDGAISMYSHLAARIILDLEEVAGPAVAERVTDGFVAALKDEIEGQRTNRRLYRERADAETQRETNKDLH